jgi:hypothetical protein
MVGQKDMILAQGAAEGGWRLGCQIQHGLRVVHRENRHREIGSLFQPCDGQPLAISFNQALPVRRSPRYM